MHPYYTTALAPGIAALCGGGGVMLWRATGWNTWLWPAVGVVMVLAIVGLFVFRSAGSGTKVRLLGVSVAAAIVAALAGPTAYAASPAFGSSAGGGMGGTNPTAGPSTGGGMGGPGGGRGGFGGGNGGPGGEMPGGTQQGGQAQGGFPGGGNGELPQGGRPGGANGEFPGGGTQGDGTQNGRSGTAPGGNGGPGGGGFGGGGMGGADSELVSYLEKHQDGAKWLIAVSNSQSAGQLILSTGKPVISMWGFTGSDQAMTPARLKELVKNGELHYIQLGGGGMGGNSSLNQEITAWVQKNGTAVKESEYGSSSSSSSSGSSNSSNSSTIYRLDPSDVS